MMKLFTYLLFSILLLLSSPYSISQKAYFELSEYVDNGNPGKSYFHSYNTQNDLGLNRVYHYGKLGAGFINSGNTPQNYLTTNGSNTGLSNNNNNIFFMVTDTVNNLSYSTAIDLGPGSQLSVQLYTHNGDAYLYGYTDSDSLETTNNTSSSGNSTDGFVIKISNNTIQTNGAQLDYATYIGGDFTRVQFLQHDGSTLWAFCRTASTNLPTTQSGNNIVSTKGYIIGISNAMMTNNAALSATNYARYLGGGANFVNPLGMLENNGDLFLLMQQGGTNFGPLTYTPSISTSTVLIKISSNTLANNLSFTAPNGNYSSYVPITVSNSSLGEETMRYHNGKIILCGIGNGTPAPLTTSTFAYDNSYLTIVALSETTMDNNGYINPINGDYFAQTGVKITFSNRVLFDIYEGNLYCFARKSNGINNGLNGITNNNTNWNNDVVYVQKIDSITIADNISPNTSPNDWIQYFGSEAFDFPRELKINKKGVHLGMQLNSTNSNTAVSLPVTYNQISPTPQLGHSFGAYINLCHEGYINHLTFLTEDDYDLNSLDVHKESVYITGKVISTENQGIINEPEHPITATSPAWGGEEEEFTFQKIVFNLDIVVEDSIFPVNQTVCKFSTPENLYGNPPAAPNDSLPELSINNQLFNQTANYSNLSYQWQVANSPTGPWGDISGAVNYSYLPEVTSYDRFYRRKSFTTSCGVASLVSISTVASIFVNNLTAPSVDAGGVLHTCPNVNLTLGASPTAIGGQGPYTYTWDNNLNPVANPVINTAQTSIVNLTVVDANGCIKKDQVNVMVHAANAGEDIAACGGIPALIGTPLPGLPGASFSWTPSTGLSCSTCPTPLANPNVETTYTLTQTIPISSGGTCTTYDSVIVDAVDSPGPNFAGEDRTICYASSTVLGTTPAAGYSYEWDPGYGLNTNQALNATFYPANLYVLGFPNPMLYEVTAQNQNCIYQDEVEIYYIRADAGLDLCDSGIVGSIDNTPNINETYSWTVVSGPGTITGPTNTPQTTVSSSIGGATVYELEVSYDGVSCTDQVQVDECAGIPITNIGSQTDIICPSTLLTSDNVYLQVSSSASNASYTWFPQTGLSSYTGQNVELLGNQHITYGVYITDTITNQLIDSAFIEVNNPNWALPDVNLVDTFICLGETVDLVYNFNTSYQYIWPTLPYFMNNTNPALSPATDMIYPAIISDPSNGCTISDTAIINVDDVTLDNPGGNDWNICSNGLVQLGIPADSNFTYLWSPSVVPWQNGTDQFSAQPEVLLANTTEFVLEYTTIISGCQYFDTVNVTVGNQPTPPNLADTGFCLGGSAQIGVPELNGVSYSWSPSTGLSCINCSETTASPTTNTTYTLSLQYENSASCPDSSFTTVNVLPSDPSFTLTDFNYCFDGDSTDLSLSSPPSGMSSYTWTPSNTMNDNNLEAPNAFLTSGNYNLNLIVVDSLGCSASGQVTINSSFVGPSAGPDQQVCLNDNPITLGSSTNTGNLTWSPATYLNSTNGAQVQFTPSSPGIFPVVITAVNGTCSQSDTVIVTVIDLPGNNSSYSEMVCMNSCTDIGTSPDPNNSYLWTPSIGLSSTNTATTTACVSQNTTYTLTITNQFLCSQSQTYNIVVNNTPPPSINLPVINACDQDSVINFSYAVTPNSGNYVYNWLPTNIFSNNNSPNPTVNNIGIGNHPFSVEVIDQNTGCIGSANSILYIDDCSSSDTCLANITLNLNAVEFCSNDTILLNINSDTLPINYNWNYSGYSQSAIGTGANVAFNYQNTIGMVDTVTIQVSPELSGCYIEDIDTFVLVHPAPTPNISGNFSYCDGDSAMLYTQNGYTSYNWNGNISSTDTSQYFTTANNPILVEIIDQNNCIYQEEFNVIEQNNQLYYDTITICQNDSILINGTYQSMPGDYTDTSATILCDSITFIHLLVSPPPTINNSFTAISICEGDDVQLNLTGASNYFLDTLPISFDDSFIPDSSGIYTIIGENNTGCTEYPFNSNKYKRNRQFKL